MIFEKHAKIFCATIPIIQQPAQCKSIRQVLCNPPGKGFLPYCLDTDIPVRTSFTQPRSSLNSQVDLSEGL